MLLFCRPLAEYFIPGQMYSTLNKLGNSFCTVQMTKLITLVTFQPSGKIFDSYILILLTNDYRMVSFADNIHFILFPTPSLSSRPLLPFDFFFFQDFSQLFFSQCCFCCCLNPSTFVAFECRSFECGISQAFSCSVYYEAISLFKGFSFRCAN